uniref:Reverse transcriptase domain-containing protein n=1 Tax=Tanacetum cinerariifolium TaxID=118510 RepID=A0A6L2MGW8_TANCI|nr:reverse transcriptase domain-containing protein [Tanacetum cinerariifolium]
MITCSSARNLFSPLDNPKLTIRRRSLGDPTVLNDLEMAAEGNGDLPVPDLQNMDELCQPSLNGQGGPIAPIAIQATNFGLKNDMIQQVHNSCQFHDFPGDDANKHLDEFLHFDCLLRNSVNTFEQMAEMFLGKYFPPSMVTKLRNEITNFRQRPDELLFEAWERYKLLIDRRLNHNMLPVTQIDTLYNELTLRHRDTINAAAGGTFMKRRLEECYDLIENMTAHHYDWDTSAQRSESSSSVTSSSDTEIAALKAEMAEINKNLMRVLQVNQEVKAVTPNYKNYGGPHSFSDCPANANDSILKNMQTNMTSLTNSNLELKNMFGQFMKMNTASSSGSGTLPGNTITNPKEELKGITTRSGTTYQGPTIPTISSSLPPVVERETEATKDMVHLTNNRSTKGIEPLVVQTESLILNSDPVVAPIIEPIAAPRTGQSLDQYGVAEDVYVKVGKFHFPADFVVVDFDADPRVPLILGRSFLKTGRALIDVFEGEPTLCVGKEAIAFNLEQTSRYSANYNDMTANQIDVIDMACEEYSQEVLGFFDVIASGGLTPYYDPIISTTSSTLTPFKDRNYFPRVRKELKICEAKSDKSSIDEAPEKLSDIKGIDPEFYTHKILMEDDFKPTVQHQRRVNPKIHDVIKNEVFKLLDAGLIYPISDSPWWCMMAIFHDMIKKTMEVFMDDFLVFRNSFQTCLSHLEKMLKRCEDTNLCLNWEKSHFMVKEGIVLGHKISKNEIKVDKAKVDVIAKLPHPTTVKGVYKAKNPLTFSRLATMDPSGHIVAQTTLPIRGNKYILVAVDYLSKWVKAKALPTNDARAVGKFLKNLFARFGTLEPLSVIEEHTSSMTSLQRIGGENHASWSNKLDDALWAFRTAYKTPIGCTSYKLVYGKTCHLLIELENKGYWALKHANFDLQTVGDHKKVKLNELNELRDQAYEKSLIYKEKTKRLHNSKIKDRVFNISDRVLLFNSRLKIFSGKLKSRWFGPFTISHVFPYGTVELS